jgi:hypothetical protein
MRSVSDRFLRSEAYRCVRLKEADILAVPWGPRVDVMFDPKSAPGIVGGKCGSWRARRVRKSRSEA